MPKGTTFIARLIEGFDMNAIASGQVDFAVYQGLDLNDVVLIGNFASATAQLAKILQRRPIAQKGRRSSTPVQPTFPQDPDYSGGSTESKNSNDSAGSTDSKPEHFTHQYAFQFVDVTVNAFRRIHKNNIDIRWINSALSKFITTYDLFYSYN
jgi:hypothetical protein